MRGISSFVTDYSLFVEELTNRATDPLSSETVVVKDPLVQLENDRKANFDTRK